MEILQGFCFLVSEPAERTTVSSIDINTFHYTSSEITIERQWLYTTEMKTIQGLHLYKVYIPQSIAPVVDPGCSLHPLLSITFDSFPRPQAIHGEVPSSSTHEMIVSPQICMFPYDTV